MAKFVSLGLHLINVDHIVTVSELKYPATGKPYVEVLTTFTDKHGHAHRISEPGTLGEFKAANAAVFN